MVATVPRSRVSAGDARRRAGWTSARKCPAGRRGGAGGAGSINSSSRLCRRTTSSRRRWPTMPNSSAASISTWPDASRRFPRSASFLDDKRAEQTPRSGREIARRTALRQPLHQRLARLLLPQNNNQQVQFLCRTDRGMGAAAAARQQALRPDGARTADRAGRYSTAGMRDPQRGQWRRGASTRPTR